MIVILIAALSRAAYAAPPVWCSAAPASIAPAELKQLSSKDVGEVIKTFVSAECAPTEEVDAHRGEIEEARRAWSRRLGMLEADWADAVAYAPTRGDHLIDATVSTDVLASATPLDQYAVIEHAHSPLSDFDSLYATDMLEASLSELGRFAFLDTMCFNTGRNPAPDAAGMLGTEALWSICQADFERLDLTKLFTELRSDAAHDGALKMKLRIAVYDLPKRIKEHAAEVQQLLKRDDANQKLFEVAAGARSAWSAAVGKNTKLLDLVLAMDSAQLAKSRKQFADCGPRTAAALAEVVSRLPAKAFAGMHDERNNPVAGFASSAGPVLVQSPAVNLAAIAFVLCTPQSATTTLLSASLASGPPLRGPRNTALARIKAANITYDKRDAKLSYPTPKPYGDHYPGSVAVGSRGGVIRTVKRNGDVVTVEVEKTLDKQEDCIKSHSTGRVSRVRSNGSVEYERVCDRSGTVVHDHTWTPFELSAKYVAWLKPGVQFSAVDGDVIAIWPSKAAKAPSMVLGGEVK